MNRHLRIFAALLFALVIVASPGAAAPLTESLEEDIAAIRAILPEPERWPVRQFLEKGAASADGPSMSPTMIISQAKRTLDSLEDDPRIIVPLARTMSRLAEGAEFPSDVRGYAFVKLYRLAVRSEEVKELTTTLATELSQRNRDVLQTATAKFLRGELQPAAPKYPFAGADLVGKWLHVNQALAIGTGITFEPDGKFSGKVAIKGRSAGKFAGKWVLYGKMLNWEYTASDVGYIRPGTIVRDTIFELTKDRCISDTFTGERIVLTRTK